MRKVTDSEWTGHGTDRATETRGPRVLTLTQDLEQGQQLEVSTHAD